MPSPVTSCGQPLVVPTLAAGRAQQSRMPRLVWSTTGGPVCSREGAAETHVSDLCCHMEAHVAPRMIYRAGRGKLHGQLRRVLPVFSVAPLPLWPEHDRRVRHQLRVRPQLAMIQRPEPSAQTEISALVKILWHARCSRALSLPFPLLCQRALAQG